MTDDTFPFSTEFQLVILKLMITDDVFLVKAAANVKEEYFNNKYLSWAFRTICKFYNDFKKSPSISTLENEVRKHDIDKQAAHFEVLKQILNAKGVEPEYVRRELTGFIRRNVFVEAHKLAASLYNNKNSEGAYEFTRRKMDELIKVDFEDDDTTRFGDAMKYVDEAGELCENAIPTGIDLIDDALNGGMAPGTLTVLLAGTNAGKSMAMVNMGYWAYRAGKKVIMTVHEDDKLSTMLRVYSRVTRIPYNKLLSGRKNLSEDEILKLKLADDALKDKWILAFQYGSETTVEQVCDWARLKKKEFNYDLLIDDYGQFIRTKQKTEGERFTQDIVYKNLKQLALELHIAVLTCAQGNREAQRVSKKGTDYLKSTDISESFGIARISSNLITLNRSDEQQSRNELVYYLEKQKSGVVGVAVKCISEYSKCITHDSVKLSTQSEIDAGLVHKSWPINSLNPLLTDTTDVKDNS